MELKSLQKKIIQLGGTVEVKTKTYPNGREIQTLTGILNGYDLEMSDNCASFYTARRISDRGHYDAGSDYNPGGFIFYDRIKDLEYLIPQKAGAL